MNFTASEPYLHHRIVRKVIMRDMATLRSNAKKNRAVSIGDSPYSKLSQHFPFLFRKNMPVPRIAK